ncbi:MAG: hypothetical protein ABJK39_04440 [Hyphomicrobiales bacterium]
MKLEKFESELIDADENGNFQAFCQKNFMHGTPFVFSGRDTDYFTFKSLICDKYSISHPDVFIVGSGKLGFSPLKRTEFSLDSDIDVAIVSASLSEKVDELGVQFEYSRRKAEYSLTERQESKYNKYLRYKAIGWTRPDLIPEVSASLKAFKSEWFDFFQSISHGRSSVGNYKVSAGLYKSLAHLEKYTEYSLKQIMKKLKVGN